MTQINVKKLIVATLALSIFSSTYVTIAMKNTLSPTKIMPDETPKIPSPTATAICNAFLEGKKNYVDRKVLLSLMRNAIEPLPSPYRISLKEKLESLKPGFFCVSPEFLTCPQISEIFAIQLLSQMISFFKKYPNISKKLSSLGVLHIEPFMKGASLVIPDHFSLSANANWDSIPHAGEPNKFLNYKLATLCINIIMYTKHEELKTLNQPPPEKYFDEVKEEIIDIALKNYEYNYREKLKDAERFIARPITINSKDWVIELIGASLNNDDPTAHLPIERAAIDWLKAQ